jgi:UDP-N-acetylmuramate: L-alanyl-gamma-D-glutamyl-meso-diaminopimelate ligase
MTAISPGSHIHLIAICGVGMASLAGMLKAQGYRVTGSDQNVYPPMSTYLANVGIEVMAGFRAEHLDVRPDLVIIGNAVSRGNPEAELVLASGIPYLSFPQALGEFLIGNRQSIVIAGTHGKTTTAALAAWVFDHAGLEPGYFVGGVPLNYGSGWRAGRGDHVVIEGDEYDTAFFDKGPKFLHYRPRYVVLTSVEFDHADIYRDLEHLKNSFRRLIEIIPDDGKLLVCGDYPAALEVASAARCWTETFGSAANSDWTAANIEMRDGATFFEPCRRGLAEGTVQMRLIGRHNISNALAVYAMGRMMSLQASGGLIEGFAGFAGVKRRQEIRGEQRGVTVIDDFAHHPTAVRETIDAVKEVYPGRKLWAVFEPRSHTSRRNIFENEFAAALARAERIIVAQLYQPEKVPQAERLSVDRVIERINALRQENCACRIDGAQDIASFIGQGAAPGDIVLVMSNGGFDGVHEKILHALAG